MALQGVSVPVRLGTQAARIRPLTSMDSEMQLKGVSPREPLAAHEALMRFLPRVGRHVTLPRNPRRELAIAHVAHERFLSGMLALVHEEAVARGELLWAQLASVRSLARMGPKVLLEYGLVAERLVAHVTHLGPHRRYGLFLCSVGALPLSWVSAFLDDQVGGAAVLLRFGNGIFWGIVGCAWTGISGVLVCSIWKRIFGGLARGGP